MADGGMGGGRQGRLKNQFNANDADIRRMIKTVPYVGGE
jgi:hypothetical protein